MVSARYIFLFCLPFVVLEGAERKLNVLMRAWADDTYIRKVGADGKPAIETCTFMKGEYYAGFYNDPESEIKFEMVAGILRDQLIDQNYTMSAEPAAADLLLVINWGMTEDPDDTDFGSDTDFDDEEDEGLGFDEDPFSQSSRRLNAQLIGASQVSGLSPIHVKSQMLREAANQERYFINVLAFSMDELRSRKKDEEMPKPEWITMLSVPLKGSEPNYAFGTMAETASVFFGKNIKNPDFIKQDAKRATVTIGELEFLDTVEDEE